MFQFAHLQKARPLVAGRPTDAFSRAFATALRDAAQRMRLLFPAETIERAIMSRNSMPLVTDARWRTIEHFLTAQVEEALSARVQLAGNEELARLLNNPVLKAELRGRFNLRNPYSEDFVRRRGGELIRVITERARRQIRDAVEAGLTQGVPVKETARIVRESLGLDPRLQRAVQNHVHALVEAGTPEDVIEASASRYASDLLSYRAELIARTETITASNQGVLDSWRQAEREDLIPKGMQKRWIHAKGSLRTCPICDELGDADPIPLNDDFFSSVSGESYARPPAHPACRCTMGLVRP